MYILKPNGNYCGKIQRNNKSILNKHKILITRDGCFTSSISLIGDKKRKLKLHEVSVFISIFFYFEFFFCQSVMILSEILATEHPSLSVRIQFKKKNRV